MYKRRYPKKPSSSGGYSSSYTPYSSSNSTSFTSNSTTSPSSSNSYKSYSNSNNSSSNSSTNSSFNSSSNTSRTYTSDSLNSYTDTSNTSVISDDSGDTTSFVSTTRNDFFVRQVVQKNHFRPYEPGDSSYDNCEDVNNLECNLGDWAFDTVNSGLNCPKRPRCSTLDPTVCPNINDSLTKAAWAEAPVIDCFYDKTKFTTAEDVNEYIHAFGKDDVYTNQLMPYFCTENSFTISGNSDEAQLCTEWAENNPSLVQDTINAKCCLKDNTGDECACNDRFNNPIYIDMKADPRLIDIDDSCWWRDCDNIDNPSIAISAGVGKCPVNLCDILNEVYNDNQLFNKYTVSEVENVIIEGCEINPRVPFRIGVVKRNTNIGLIILFIIFIVFIISLILFLVFRNRPTTTTDTTATNVDVIPTRTIISTPVQ